MFGRIKFLTQQYVTRLLRRPELLARTDLFIIIAMAIPLWCCVKSLNLCLFIKTHQAA